MFYSTIATGKFKGKKILLPSTDRTRSTKSVVKSSFFDTTRYELSNRVFVECFGGSGLMGAEALSNNASSVIVIEKDNHAYNIANKNLQSLSSDFKIFNGDCFNTLPKILKPDNSYILYFDPPFNIRDGFDDIYERLIELIKEVLNFDIFMICIEHISSYKFDEIIGDFRLLKSKKFGKTTLSYYVRS